MSMHSFLTECRVMLSDLWLAVVRNEIISQANCLLQSVVMYQPDGYYVSSNNRVGIHSCLFNLRQVKSFRCLSCISIANGFLISEFPFQYV